MSNAGDMIELKKTGTAFHGMKQAEYGIDGFIVGILAQLNDRRLQLLDHVLAFLNKFLDNFYLITAQLVGHGVIGSPFFKVAALTWIKVRVSGKVWLLNEVLSTEQFIKGVNCIGLAFILSNN